MLRRARTHGFSLIEVNLAILMVSVGLLSLFSLFPLGLRENEMGIQETQEAMFADHVLGAVESVASDIVDWRKWESIDAFKLSLTSGMAVDPELDKIVVDLTDQASPHTIRFPKVLEASESEVRELRYRLSVSNDGTSGLLKTIRLKVKSGKYGEFELGQTYVTQVFYMGY